MVAVYIVIGFIGGGVITCLLMLLQQSKLKQQQSIGDNEKLQLQNEQSRLLEEKESILKEKSLLNEEIHALEETNRQLGMENASLKTQLQMTEEREQQLKTGFDEERDRLEKLREQSEAQSEKLRQESDKQWLAKFEKLKEEIRNLTHDALSEKQEKLQENNREQIGELLNPLRKQFDDFKKSVEDSKTSNELSKKDLKDSFENTLKMFAQQQNQAVENLKQETARIGNDAKNLTNALKRDTKKQGNWGELILETLLESSGLEKDRHYFIQETVKDEEGKMLRPDVIVKFPEGRAVVIDSKVSLTAYTEAFETEDDDLKRRRLKDHARSVRKHVDELAGKKYDDVVSDAIGFILMFIPNDQCYLAAMEEDTDLSRYAYAKGIVIISPSNLLMALQLAFNMWQQNVRNQKVEEIVKAAADLYDKVAGFQDTMNNVEKYIGQLSDAFDKAKKQLYDGNGNIFRKVESLKAKGVTPKKQLKGLENDAK